MSENYYHIIRKHLSEGDIVQNWTVLKGHTGEDFVVEDIQYDRLTIKKPDDKTLTIRSNEFDAFGEYWNDYKKGLVRRKDIMQRTFYSKYLISIFHKVFDL